MKSRIKVVHLTPHLGGGIGKTLLALAGAQQGTAFEHAFVLLEHPEKTVFLDGLQRLGCTVEIAANGEIDSIKSILAEADIVQLEWWNHPATFPFLCGADLPPMRLLAWSHVSGLHTPVIPAGLIESAGRFVFSSSCSLEAPAIMALDAGTRARTGVVHSGVGLDAPAARSDKRIPALRAGYLGSLNFSKLHPRIVDYLAAVDLPDFTLRVWGDVQNRQELHDECRRHGKDGLIAFEGFTEDVAANLARLDVLAYLLNPAHYGTGENALVEAMSAGVIPVVLNNPAERAIVEHGRTGLIVDSPRAFAAAIRWLADHPDERHSMSENARAEAARRFSPASLGKAMAQQYQQVLTDDKRTANFRSILGDTPADWFLSCQAAGRDFAGQLPALARDTLARHGLHETSKGSLRHFLNRFPDDPQLREWQRLCAEEVQP